MRNAAIKPFRRVVDLRLIVPIGIFLVYSVFAVLHLTQKAGLPLSFRVPNVGSSTFLIDGVEVRTDDDVEFVLSGYRVGAPVRLVVKEGAATGDETVILVPYYEAWAILFDLAITVITIGLGLLVALYYSDTLVARVFLAASIALGTALLGTKTLYSLQPPWLGATLCTCFFLAYSSTPVLFLHFSSLFPVRRIRTIGPVTIVIYAGAVAMALWQTLVYLKAGETHSVELFRRSVSTSTWMNGQMVAGIVAGLVLLVGSYHRAATPSERKKAAWVLFGLVAGTLPFGLFWALPQTFGRAPLIPEMLFKVFLLAIPVSFAIAILRYRLIDITTLISRSVIHALVVGALLVLYALLIGLTMQIIPIGTIETSLLLLALAALISAVAYNSISRWAQRLVDRSFFHLSYDFRGSLKEVLDDLKRSRGTGEIAERLIAGVEKLLPVDRIIVFTLEQPGNRLRALAERNFPILRKHSVTLEIDRLKSDLELPVAVDSHIEQNVRHESADADVFGRWGISLALPMKARGGKIRGFIVLGRKTSGLMFTEEDVDLLTVVAGEVAGEIERLHLERILSLERAQAERLEELNRLKSYFVASVSHDLKTPLTSIRMFSELLRSNRGLSAATVDEYLAIIGGESDRLTRLIDNVLDFAKIEKGMKAYDFKETELNDIVSTMMKVMQYQFQIEKCEVACEPAGGLLLLTADPDAVLEALLNLVTNAVKYSAEPKRIRIRTFAEAGAVGIAVEDNGFGIPPEELELIFQPFHRVVGGQSASAGGTGLGLSIVKHIVDAHRGTIQVVSEPGRGSTFTMVFPDLMSPSNRGDQP